MKKFMSLMLLVCACLLNQPVKAQQVTPDNAGYIVKVGDMAPDFEMELTDGQKVKLSDLRGKVVMLQFTASWCGVCRKEMHAMSHPVSAYFDVPHGVANAILLPTILDYNKLADKGKYKKIYEYVSETHRSDESFTPDMLVDAIRALNNSLSIPANLTEVGVTEDKIDVMADDAMKSGNIMVNPRRSTKKDIVALYKKAM